MRYWMLPVPIRYRMTVLDDGIGRYRYWMTVFSRPCSMGSTVGSDGLIAINDRDRASIHESSPSSDDRPITNQGSRCVDEEALRF